MKILEKIFVDFNNADKEGRVRLNTNEAFKDIETKKIMMKAGTNVLLDDHDGLKTIGILEFSQKENIWVAKIDWNKLNNSL